MAKRFSVGDRVEWNDGRVKLLNGKIKKVVRKGRIESIDDPIMFIWVASIGHYSAKRIKGRWLAYKSNEEYQLRIRHARRAPR